MVRIAVTGAAGKMGKANIKIIAEDKETELSAALEFSASPFIGADSGETAGIGQNGIKISADLDKALQASDALIDFSSPQAFSKYLEMAVQYKKAFICGTTGLTESDQEKIRKAAEIIPVIWAPNFSVGVTLIAKLTRIAAQVLDQGFDAEIVEAHHRMKKDSPSGTAIKLLKVLQDVYETNDVVYGREGICGERPERQIGVSAVRGGDVVGDHTVYFLGNGERVEITHKASSRETFARGAVRAAKAVVAGGKGLYTMEKILGL